MADPNSPAVVFQSLLRTMLDGSLRTLTKRNVEDFRVILHMIMHECSKANIETGKTWVFDHCHSPAHTAALMEYILSLSRSRSGQEERIHIIYLLNDILFHTTRKQLSWMKDAMLPALVPLLKLAYEAAESAEYKAKLMKVITFWSDKNIFEPNIINNIRRDITEQATSYKQLPHFDVNQQQTMRFQQAPHPFAQHNLPQFQQNPMVQHQPPLPTKQYYEMPAGLMLFAKNDDYKPIDPAMIKYPFPRPQPSKELLDAVNDFYAGLDLSSVDDMILDEKTANNIDVQGWEKGYLDQYVESMTQRKQEQLEDHQKQASRSRSREYSRSSYHRNSSRDYDRRSRSPSPYHSSYRRRQSYSRSRSHSRSHSHSRSRSRSRSRSHSPQSRRRSPPRGRSPINRRAQRSPPPRLYSSRRPYRSRSRSRSRSPPPLSTASFMSNYRPSSSNGSISNNSTNRGADFGARPGIAPENRYMGLGSKSALDEFDSFRRNKSQAFNRREPHQPITCYRCNKAGHLARECNSL